MEGLYWYEDNDGIGYACHKDHNAPIISTCFKQLTNNIRWFKVNRPVVVKVNGVPTNVMFTI